MKLFWRNIAALAGVILLLTGCSGNVDIGPNVTLVSISSPEARLYSPGQPFSADFTVRSDRITAEHVGVSFFIIEAEKAGQLETNEDAEAFFVGEHYIKSLTPGTFSLTANLMVPNEELTQAGNYLLVAIVDAAGVVETDDNLADNRSRNVTRPIDDSWGEMQIDLEHHHDFILAKVEIGEGFLLLPRPIDHDPGEIEEPDTMHSDLIGFVDAIKHGNNEDTAVVTGVMTVAGVEYTAHFWHEFDDTYTDSMDIVFPNHEEEHYFPWDIALNGELVHALADAYDSTIDENTFTLTMTIVDTSPTPEEDLDNNSLSIEVPYFFFEEDVATQQPVAGDRRARVRTPSTGVLEVTNDYSHTYGDASKVALSLGLSNEMNLNVPSGTADLSANGGFNLNMFNKSASLMSSDLSASASAFTVGAEYELTVAFLGLPVIEESDSVSDRLSKEWSQEWSEEVTLFETTITVAIIPVKLEAGITGSVGIGAGLGFDNLVISATGTVLTSSLDVYAEASINLLVASGGVGAELIVVQDDFEIVASADLSEAITNNKMTLSLDVENTLKAIEGEFYLFVRYTGYKFCCKFPKKEARFTIYNTGALYDKTWTLLSVSREISL